MPKLVKLLNRFAGIPFFRSSTQGKRARKSFPAPHVIAPDFELLLRGLGAIGCAAALALARVLAFAAVVVSLAAALAFAGVLPFTSVLFFDFLVVLLVLVLALILRAERSLQRGEQSRGPDCRTGPGEQSR